MTVFYNRNAEMSALARHWDARGAQFVLLYGRRRVGKTFLLQHFLEQDRAHCYYLASQTSRSESISELASTLVGCFPDSGFAPADLGTLNSILRFVGRQSGPDRFALVLDEFQYLLQQDPSMASQIQSWWDTEGIRSRVFMVVCGSHLGVMEGLGGHQSPLFGRFTFRHKLQPMGYRDIADFYAESAYSDREKLIAYGVLGGTPRYHAVFDPHQPIADNIRNWILSPMGLLHNEAEFLISSSQVRDPAPYNAVLMAIASGCTQFSEVANRVGATTQQLSFHLGSLRDLEWVTREYPFGETSDRRAIYKIADNFIYFWYRFVARLRSELEFQDVRQVYEARVEPHLNDYMGRYVFEEICHEYLRTHGSRVLGQTIKRAGRYWSRDGQLELDVVAELENGRFLLGECKWSSSPIGVDVYYELQQKAARLPDEAYQNGPTYILFSLSGFDDSLRQTAARDGVAIVSGEDLLA